MVRPELVRRKLQLIAEDLGRLTRFRDETLQSLAQDYVRMAAVERMLERMVTRAIDVNMHLISELTPADTDRITRITYRETFLRLAALGVYPPEFAERVADSAGLRNILVHDYNNVDAEILHASIRRCLTDYADYVGHVEAFLERVGEAAESRRSEGAKE